MLFCGIFGLLLLPDPAGIAWILAGVIAAALFVWWQKQCSHPILDLAIFRANRTFTFSNIAAMINYGATYGVGFLLSLYLQYIKGFSAETAGLILVAQPRGPDHLLTGRREDLRPGGTPGRRNDRHGDNNARALVLHLPPPRDPPLS